MPEPRSSVTLQITIEKIVFRCSCTYRILFVEVRLKENGSECLEVVDNGSGVDEENFDALSKTTCINFFGMF